MGLLMDELQLFTASNLMEARQSRALGENVQLLTFVSIFFLPLGFVMVGFFCTVCTVVCVLTSITGVLGYPGCQRKVPYIHNPDIFSTYSWCYFVYYNIQSEAIDPCRRAAFLKIRGTHFTKDTSNFEVAGTIRTPRKIWRSFTFKMVDSDNMFLDLAELTLDMARKCFPQIQKCLPEYSVARAPT